MAMDENRHRRSRPRLQCRHGLIRLVLNALV